MYGQWCVCQGLVLHPQDPLCPLQLALRGWWGAWKGWGRDRVGVLSTLAQSAWQITVSGTSKYLFSVTFKLSDNPAIVLCKCIFGSIIVTPLALNGQPVLGNLGKMILSAAIGPIRQWWARQPSSVIVYAPNFTTIIHPNRPHSFQNLRLVLATPYLCVHVCFCV